MNRRIVIVPLVLVVIVGCIWCLAKPSSPHNSVAYLARTYGVSKETVLTVVHAYKVNPDELYSYGESPFPVNYIEHTLGWTWNQAEHPTIYRSEVEALVTGYISRCDLSSTTTLYLFYSDWLRPKALFRGEALPMEVTYELDPEQSGMQDDQIVQSITFYFLSDSGGLPWEQVAPICDPPARY